jgi:prepilin-type N-terminal cleavage/methylation domain-containing protein
MKTLGMTLIEMVVALAISSLLTLLLYQSLNQTQKTTSAVDAIFDYALSAPIAYNQLDKDISSIFVPEQVFRNLMEEQKKKEKKSADDKKQNQMQKENINEEPLTDGSKDKPTEKLKNIFVATKKGKELESISFLSTHSLSLFNAVVPRSVRVVYRLVPAQNGLFVLIRQESTKLDLSLEKFKEIREYELMRGIREFSMQFLIPDPQKDAKKPEEKKYKAVEAWLPEEVEKEGKKSEALIPEFIIIKGVTVHESTQREYPFEWWFKVLAFDGVVQRVEKIKNVTKKSAEKKDVPQEVKGTKVPPTLPPTKSTN